MENLNEDFKMLSELLRTAYKLISPITYHDDLNRLTPEFVQQDAKQKPGCYLKLGQGADHTLFPICNRYGYKDPQMIKFSLKLAKKMSETNTERDMSGAIVKLEKLLNKYNKEVPNTRSQAILKGKATKTFNKKMQSTNIKTEKWDINSKTVASLTWNAIKQKIEDRKKKPIKQKVVDGTKPIKKRI